MSDIRKTRFINASRRGFLQGAAIAGGSAVAGAAVSGEFVAVDQAPAPDAPAQKGYERTEHVKRYYKRARF